MKGEIFRLKDFALLTLACVSMWGCGWDEDVEDLSSRYLIGYSGDSLVVYIERKYEETCLAKPLGDDCSTREKGTRIVVDNFYTEENVWKSDKLRDQYVVNVYDLVDDSTVIEFEKNKSHFYKWTLGKDSEDLGYFEWDGCSTKEKVGSIRPWGDGKWRLVGSTEDCGYAIVDVSKKKITGYEKLDEFAEGCSDLWIHEGAKYCVGVFEKDTIISYYERYQDGIYLKNQDGRMDSLWSHEIIDRSNALSPDPSYSPAFILVQIGYFTRRILKIDYSKSKFDRTYDEVYLDGLYVKGK